ncbi:hypothetical protein DOTSEDRAFT_29009 [Dothistroma septosporum NZE10]|uniref:Uncharacterized protein n=1 Tax=Dothistroma septosporum (strain NZE10 / CBS 128990) TaxID=675120 RepID=M2WIM5_DOTSN|nr:hypothetical protein DOTSEDRAFT_29009 [Dothistroma septosporum NZE10]
MSKAAELICIETIRAVETSYSSSHSPPASSAAHNLPSCLGSRKWPYSIFGGTASGPNLAGDGLMRFNKALFALSLAGALAAPTPALGARGRIAADQSSCRGFRHTWNAEQSVYQVVIGRPYLGGARCPEIKSEIPMLYKIDHWLKCSGSSKNKNTKLTIVSNMSQSNQLFVNEALHNAYPEITFNRDTSLSMNRS